MMNDAEHNKRGEDTAAPSHIMPQLQIMPLRPTGYRLTTLVRVALGRWHMHAQDDWGSLHNTGQLEPGPCWVSMQINAVTTNSNYQRLWPLAHDLHKQAYSNSFIAQADTCRCAAWELHLNHLR